MSDEILASGQVNKVKWEMFPGKKSFATHDGKHIVNFRIFREYTWNDEIKKAYTFAIWETRDIDKCLAQIKEAYEHYRASDTQEPTKQEEDIF